MKREKLIIFIVIVGLLAYLALTLLSYLDVFGYFGDTENSVLLYFTNAFTGLVGGIVASGFGVDYKPPGNGADARGDVPTPPTPENGNISRRARKFRGMGRMAVPETTDDEKREKLGELYAWSYIIVGIITCVIAISLGFIRESNDLPSGFINQAYTFVGMLVAIITMYLSNGRA
jgi:hypothetical protein